MKLVSIIIVSWNGLHWLKKSLPTLQKVVYGSLEIILVDNSSTDGTKEWVKKYYPQINVISINQNLGYAEANNRGYEASKGEYLLFLNNDVEVMPSFIAELVTAVEKDSSIAGAQSKILLLEDRNRYDTIGAYLTPTGFLYHYCFMNKENKLNDHSIDVFTPKGACMLFKRSSLESVLLSGKLFDKDAFAYYEETDVAHRIWLSGKRIIYAPKSVIYHKMGGTSTKMDNAFIQFHSFKNRIASFIKNISLQNLIPLLFIHFFVIQIFALASIFKRNASVAFAIEKAILWNMLHFSAILKKRKYIQKNIRTVPDSSFWNRIVRYPPVGYYIAQMSGKPFKE